MPQSSITVFDTSRFIPGNLYDKIHSEFPGVVFVDHIGGDGRLKTEFKPNAIPFSVPAAMLQVSIPRSSRLPT